MDRELARKRDEFEARRAALEQFGDPGRLAFRLWFDAMKGHVMKSRILIAAILVVGVVTCMVLWSIYRQSVKVNEAMLTRLAALSPPAVRGDLTRLTVTPVSKQTDGPGVPGATVELQGHAINPNETAVMTRQTDASGQVTFEPIRPAIYVVRVRNDGMTMERIVSVFPGGAKQEQIICPVLPLADVAFAIHWPSVLADTGYLVRCEVEHDHPKMRVTDESWSLPTVAEAYLNPSGQVLAVKHMRDEPGIGRVMWRVIQREPAPPVESLKVPAGEYGLKSISLIQPRGALSEGFFGEFDRH